MANSSTEPIYVDDLDSMLSYTGVWFTSTSSYNFQNSSHGTNTAGSSVRFEFKGSQISVYGSVDPSSQSACIRPPISTYVLDNMPMATFFAPTTESQLNNSLFYESPALVDGHHTLVITSASQNSLFWFDYIKYTPSDCEDYVSGTRMAVTSTSSSNRGSILGGAIGGAVFFAALIALAIFLMRRKRAEEPLFPSLRRVLHLKRSRTYQHITPYSITSIPSSTEFLTTSPPGVLGAEFDGPQMSEVQRSALASGSSTALQPTEQDLRHTPPITNAPLKKLNTAYRPQTHARTRSWQRHSSESLQDIDFPPEYQSCA